MAAVRKSRAGSDLPHARMPLAQTLTSDASKPSHLQGLPTACKGTTVTQTRKAYTSEEAVGPGCRANPALNKMQPTQIMYPLRHYSTSLRRRRQLAACGAVGVGILPSTNRCLASFWLQAATCHTRAPQADVNAWAHARATADIEHQAARSQTQALRQPAVRTPCHSGQVQDALATASREAQQHAVKGRQLIGMDSPRRGLLSLWLRSYLHRSADVLGGTCHRTLTLAESTAH
jgi:hypothetical protein